MIHLPGDPPTVSELDEAVGTHTEARHIDRCTRKVGVQQDIELIEIDIKTDRAHVRPDYRAMGMARAAKNHQHAVQLRSKENQVRPDDQL